MNSRIILKKKKKKLNLLYQLVVGNSVFVTLVLLKNIVNIMNSNCYNFKQARICKSCKTTETHQWRRGPDGRGKFLDFINV